MRVKMSNPKAAVVIIGNEILSGRTLDINTQEIALRLTEIGVDLIETRTIADDRQMIIKTIKEMSAKYDYVFTTGGIGPTHDDITSESIAAAFNVKYIRNEDIYNVLKNHYESMGEQLNPAREKMAYIPEGAVLLHNDATAVPGFAIRNVFVMAGIPYIMKSMLQSALPMLKHGKVVKTLVLEVIVGESKIAVQFENLQKQYPDVEMGSYPFTRDGKHATSLVLRSTNYDLLDKSFAQLKEILKTYL
ncbi:MAG: competence/damage-inducible protein A [Rickettsiales bacterium]|nr:competence/damage-inducible protein A [Rickettsiales bacterium]MCA0254185.1 competence/damage-inducible protein A [Pseudomonadota bacterium]